jgi:hypothetical protein
VENFPMVCRYWVLCDSVSFARVLPALSSEEAHSFY